MLTSKLITEIIENHSELSEIYFKSILVNHETAYHTAV